MERYCAEIVDSVVVRVLVCDNADWCVRHLGGQWIFTGERLVGIGWPVVDGEIVEPEPDPEPEGDEGVEPMEAMHPPYG